MLTTALLDRLFDALSIQRWNDQLRPRPLVEMDKHAHKMAAAYCLARAEEDAGRTMDWPRLVEGGVFELLRRAMRAVSAPLSASVGCGRGAKVAGRQAQPRTAHPGAARKGGD